MKGLLLLLVLFCSSFAFDPANYTKNTTLSSAYIIYWTVQGNEIFLALQAQTNGWVGFGLAEPTSGSMPGSDMVTGK